MVDSAAIEQWIRTLPQTEQARVRSLSPEEQARTYASIFQSGQQPQVSSGRQPLMLSSETCVVGDSCFFSAISQENSSSCSAGARLAQKMREYASNHWSAVSHDTFQGYINEFSRLPASEMINFIHQFYMLDSDNRESVIELIMDEFDSADVEKRACSRIFYILTEKAKELGINVDHYRSSFNIALGTEYHMNLLTTSSTELDRILNAVVTEMEEKLRLRPADENSQVGIKDQASVVNDVINSRLQQARQIFQAQEQADGWAGHVSDFFRRFFNANYTSESVQDAISRTERFRESLIVAANQSEDEYKRVFHNIFRDTNYNYENIMVCQAVEMMYVEALAEKSFNDDMDFLLHYDSGQFGQLEAVDYLMVYDKGYEKLAEYLGGKDVLDELLKQSGLSEFHGIEDRCRKLQDIAKIVQSELHKNKARLCGNQSFEDIETKYNAAYNAAFGFSNDAMYIASRYSVAQQTGAALVKAGTMVAMTALCAAGGLAGMCAAAGITTGAVEVTDRMTSGRALEAFRQNGLAAYFDTVSNDIDYNALMDDMVINAGSVLIGGFVARGISFIPKSCSRAVLSRGVDVSSNLVYTRLTEGELRIGGVVLTVLLANGGKIVAIKRKDFADSIVRGERINTLRYRNFNGRDVQADLGELQEKLSDEYAELKSDLPSNLMERPAAVAQMLELMTFFGGKINLSLETLANMSSETLDLLVRALNGLAIGIESERLSRDLVLRYLHTQDFSITDDGKFRNSNLVSNLEKFAQVFVFLEDWDTPLDEAFITNIENILCGNLA